MRAWILDAGTAYWWAAIATADTDVARRALENIEHVLAEEPANGRGLNTLFNIAYLARFVDPEEALVRSDELVAAARATEQHFCLFSALAHRGPTKVRLRRPPGAMADFVEALPHGVAVADWRLKCTVTETVARIMSIVSRRQTSMGVATELAPRQRLDRPLRSGIGDEYDVIYAEGQSLEEGVVFQLALPTGTELLADSTPDKLRSSENAHMVPSASAPNHVTIRAVSLAGSDADRGSATRFTSARGGEWSPIFALPLVIAVEAAVWWLPGFTRRAFREL